jgi:hypothetical protein
MKLSKIEITKTEIVIYSLLLFLVGAFVIYCLPAKRQPPAFAQEKPQGVYVQYEEDELEKLRNCKRAVDCDRLAEKLRAQGKIK